jgi:hypothetical protein
MPLTFLAARTAALVIPGLVPGPEFRELRTHILRSSIARNDTPGVYGALDPGDPWNKSKGKQAPA